MTSRALSIRANEWKSAGREVSNLKVVQSGLYYDEAQALENSLLNEKCGQCKYCEGHLGGQRVEGPVYTVYTYRSV